MSTLNNIFCVKMCTIIQKTNGGTVSWNYLEWHRFLQRACKAPNRISEIILFAGQFHYSFGWLNCTSDDTLTREGWKNNGAIYTGPVQKRVCNLTGQIWENLTRACWPRWPGAFKHFRSYRGQKWNINKTHETCTHFLKNTMRYSTSQV